MTHAPCSTCPYFHAHTVAPDRVVVKGTCHRYPPTPLLGAGQVRPIMSADDGCGEHPAWRAIELTGNQHVVSGSIDPHFAVKPGALTAINPPQKRKAKR